MAGLFIVRELRVETYAMDLRRLSGWSMFLGLTLLPLVSNAAGKCERLVVTGSPDAPPYLWQDPQNPKHLILSLIHI